LAAVSANQDLKDSVVKTKIISLANQINHVEEDTESLLNTN